MTTSNVPDKMMIEMVVGNMHCMTPDAEVEADMRRRFGKMVLDSIVDDVVDYALKVHHDNRELYLDVVGARI